METMDLLLFKLEKGDNNQPVITISSNTGLNGTQSAASSSSGSNNLLMILLITLITSGVLLIAAVVGYFVYRKYSMNKVLRL